MQYRLLRHQHKAKPYQQALEAAGIRQSTRDPQFLLADHDISTVPEWPYRRECVHAAAQGWPIFLYPHCAQPPIHWDGIYPVFDGVTAHFLPSEGQAEVMRSYGYPKELIVVGWALNEIRPFRPLNRNVQSVLFAPIHPNGNGWLSETDKQLNRKTLEQLLRCCVKITVRYFHTLEENGLIEVPGVNYVLGKPDGSLAEAWTCDAVVAAQTYAYLAIAAGFPTIMINGETRPCSGNSEANFRTVSNWEAYKDLWKFPFDSSQTPMRDLMGTVGHQSKELDTWKERFIGQPFNGSLFVKSIIERVNKRR